MEATGNSCSEIAFRIGHASIANPMRSNEDYTKSRLSESGCLLALADGIGGAPFGEALSHVAVNSSLSYAMDHPIEDAFYLTHEKVIEFVDLLDSQGSGCSLILGCLDQASSALTLVWAGDAIAFLSREGRFNRLCEPFRIKGTNRLSNCLGAPQKFVPGFLELELRKGDRIMLCSDGVWDSLPNEALANVLEQPLSPPILAGMVVDKASRHSSDDCTALIVECE
ncbi:PP2C family protein-serine/threonine phosphatase [Adlercreutzia equolifaciens]|uniref:PP2C family protein-serine/threonine phosphatase n=1 Tax=Adlercreutzia equolifaciens TaxID=446660 RepID=UPI00266D1E53|nr:protein phosphatase 2C domain-containing protein [Adlercreutzia equolifaciens]